MDDPRLAKYPDVVKRQIIRQVGPYPLVPCSA